MTNLSKRTIRILRVLLFFYYWHRPINYSLVTFLNFHRRTVFKEFLWFSAFLAVHVEILSYFNCFKIKIKKLMSFAKRCYHHSPKALWRKRKFVSCRNSPLGEPSKALQIGPHEWTKAKVHVQKLSQSLSDFSCAFQASPINS